MLKRENIKIGQRVKLASGRSGAVVYIHDWDRYNVAVKTGRKTRIWAVPLSYIKRILG